MKGKSDSGDEQTPTQVIVTPAQADAVLETIRAFEFFKTKVLTPKDFATIQGHPWIKKSGWAKYSLACNVSTEVREERIEEHDGHRVYHFTYRAIHLPSGRFADAVGSASEAERKAWNHPEHDVRSLAQTRAFNRAVSNLVGGGEVSAEEIDAQGIQFHAERTREKEQTQVPFIDQEGILDDIERAGLDTTALSIYPEGERFIVKPLRFLGDVWRKYNTVLGGMGFTWIRAGKDSRWQLSHTSSS